MYYLNNKERIRKYHNEWAMRNRDSLRLYHQSYSKREDQIAKRKEYYKKNSDYFKRMNRLRWVDNRDRYLERKRDYYLKNKDLIKIGQLRYYRNNSDSIKDKRRTYYKQKLSLVYKENVEKLSTRYVKSLLRQSFGYKSKELDMYPELIQLKRLEVACKRILTNNYNKNHGTNK